MTDANVVLGYLNPETFLGGRAALDGAAAAAAVDRLATPLGVDRTAAAAGIHRVVNTRMAEGIRLVSVRRGVDPRRFAILAFGGAAGLHVTEVARQLEIRRVIVPRLAAVLSAWGMLASDLRCELARTHLGDASRVDPEDLRAAFAAMETEGRRRLEEAAFEGPVGVQRSVDMRYGEQVFEVQVGLEPADLDAPDLMARLAEAFHARHEELFTYALRDREAVLVNARAAVVGELPALPEEPLLPERPMAGPVGTRRAYLDGWRDVPAFDADALAPGQRIDGPGIVESGTTTVLLRARDRAVVTPLGWLDVEVGPV